MLDGICHIHKRLTTRSILVSTAIEVALSKDIDIYIASRAQRHTDEVGMLGKHRRHLHLLNLQGVVHKALAIALLEPEATHLLLSERHIGNRSLAQQLHLAVDGVAKQAGTTLGEGVIYIIIYLRDVDARRGQDSERLIQLGREIREREVARVGHHTHIQHLCLRCRHALSAPQRLDDFIDEVAGARRLGVREHNIELLRGVEVVVDKHTLSRCVGGNHIAQRIQT